MKMSRRKPRCVDGNVPLRRCGSCSAVVCQEQKEIEKENPICVLRRLLITDTIQLLPTQLLLQEKYQQASIFAFIFWISLSGSLNSELLNFLFQDFNAQKPFKNSQFLLAFLGVNLIPIRSATCEGCKSDLYVSLLRMSNATRWRHSVCVFLIFPPLHRVTNIWNARDLESSLFLESLRGALHGVFAARIYVVTMTSFSSRRRKWRHLYYINPRGEDIM